MLVLLIPWLICLLLVVTIITTLRKFYRISITVLLAALCLNWWFKCFSLYSLTLLSSNAMMTYHDIKVMAWNIDGFKYDSIRICDIANMIIKEDPDVLFLAENYNQVSYIIDSILVSNYPYSSRPNYYNGHTFYSKYPLDNVRVIDTDGVEFSLRIHCRINIEGNDIDIYGCHLTSNNYSPEHNDLHIEKVGSFSDAFSFLRNTNVASQIRSKETTSILSDINDGKRKKVIVMGDFNDVSGSLSLRVLEKAGFDDAWWKGGIGYGATIHHPLPYRIDHIMYKDGLILKSIKKVDAKELSDHDALTAVFEIKQ